MLSTLRGRGLQYTSDRLSPSFRTEVDALGLFARHTAEVIICTRRACSGGDKIASSQPTYSGNGSPFIRLRDATSQGFEASYQLRWQTPGLLDPNDSLTVLGGAEGTNLGFDRVIGS